LFVDTQTGVPVVTKDASQAIWEKEKRNRGALEGVMIKATKSPAAAQGLLVLFGGIRRAAAKEDSAESEFVRWAVGVSMETLRMGMDLAGTL
jgi:nucleolar MIF4G domain-containing protein 1